MGPASLEAFRPRSEHHVEDLAERHIVIHSEDAGH